MDIARPGLGTVIAAFLLIVAVGLGVAVLNGSVGQFTGVDDGGAGVDPDSSDAAALTEQLVTLLEDYNAAPPAEKEVLAAEMRRVAQNRRDQLKTVAEENPHQFHELTLPSRIEAEMPQSVTPLIETRVSTEMMLHAVHGDLSPAALETRSVPFRVSIVSPSRERRSRVVFTGEQPRLRDGFFTAEVQGVKLGDILVVATPTASAFNITSTFAHVFDPVTASTAGSSSGTGNGEASNGSQRTAVILWNYEENDNEAISPAGARSMMEKISGFYRNTSYGQVWFGGYYNTSADIYGWYTVESGSDEEPRCWNSLDKAVAEAEKDGFNETFYDAVIYATPGNQDDCFAAGYYAGGKSVYVLAKYFDGITASHELGHYLGMSHSDEIDECSKPLLCQGGRAYGGTDVMDHGGLDPPLNVHHRISAGFLDSEEYRYITEDGKYSLYNMKKAESRQKAIIVPRGNVFRNTRAPHTLYKEKYPRREGGFPQYLVLSHGGAVQIEVSDNRWRAIEPGLQEGWRSLKEEGDTLRDSFASLNVTVVSLNQTGATINVDAPELVYPGSDLYNTPNVAVPEWQGALGEGTPHTPSSPLRFTNKTVFDGAFAGRGNGFSLFNQQNRSSTGVKAVAWRHIDTDSYSRLSLLNENQTGYRLIVVDGETLKLYRVAPGEEILLAETPLTQAVQWQWTELTLTAEQDGAVTATATLPTGETIGSVTVTDEETTVFSAIEIGGYPSLVDDIRVSRLSDDHVVTAEDFEFPLGNQHKPGPGRLYFRSPGTYTYKWSFTNCPDTCPELHNATGTLETGERVIPGPVYTPQHDGRHSLELSVETPEGNHISRTIHENGLPPRPQANITINNGSEHTNSLNFSLQTGCDTTASTVADGVASRTYFGTLPSYMSISPIHLSGLKHIWQQKSSGRTHRYLDFPPSQIMNELATVYYHCKDDRGMRSQVAKDDIIVDTTPPTVNMTRPVNGHIYVYDTDAGADASAADEQSTVVGSVTVAVNAVDNNEIANVSFYVNPSSSFESWKKKKTVSEPPYTWYWEAETLEAGEEPGEHPRVKAEAIDKAGNRAAVEQAVRMYESVGSLPIQTAAYQHTTPVTVTNNWEKPLQGYPVAFTFDTAHPVQNQQMKSDCSDIVVTDPAGDIRPHFIDKQTCNQTDTQMYVQIGEIPATTSKTFFLHYGNPTAPDISTGRGTFRFFEDGEVGVKGESAPGWVTVRPTEPKKSDDVLKISGNAYSGSHSVWKRSGLAVHAFNTSNLHSGDTGLQLSTKMRLNTEGKVISDLGLAHPAVTYDTRLSWNNSVQTFTVMGRDGETQQKHNTYLRRGEWYDTTLTLLPVETGVNVTAEMRQSSVEGVSAHVISNPLEVGNVLVSGQRYWFDNLKVRKIVEPAPTVTVGEESMETPIN